MLACDVSHDGIALDNLPVSVLQIGQLGENTATVTGGMVAAGVYAFSILYVGYLRWGSPCPVCASHQTSNFCHSLGLQETES